MHRSHTELQHDHLFNDDHTGSQRGIVIVAVITAVTMAAEIVAGTLFGSMALVADGWHMGTHMLALGVSLVAYALARRYMRDSRFAFGTWKIEILGGYTSALLLGAVGISMCFASVERIVSPVTIQYDHALLVAIIGLAVNVVSALILAGSTTGHDHAHHNHQKQNPHTDTRHRDINMHAAYIHVVTDALTSGLAIGALVVAKYLDWNFMDPAAGLIGAGLILRWTYGLLKESGSILLDRESDAHTTEEIRAKIESDGVTRVSDLHVWQIAGGKYACIVVLVTQKDRFTIADFKNRLGDDHDLVHTSIEMHYFK